MLVLELLSLACAVVGKHSEAPLFVMNDEVVAPQEPVAPESKLYTSVSGKVQAWNVHTHAAFPKYSLRVRESSTLCDSSVKQVTGYLDVDDDKHFYFWFFESRSSPSKDPLSLWLNGGPGCSSLTGLLMELGPCRVNPGGDNTTVNPHSWNARSNIIFLDQVKSVNLARECWFQL